MKIKKEKNQKLIQKINQKIILGILIILSFYNLIFIAEKAIYKTDIFTIVSTKIYINPKSKQSMKKAIRTNSLLFISKNNNKAFNVGDIITYYENGDFKIRRIVGINKDNTYIIKGDNNYYNEPKNLKKSEIEGKVVISIPYLGVVFKVLQSWVMTIFIMVFGVILFKRSSYLKKKSYKRRELRKEKKET